MGFRVLEGRNPPRFNALFYTWERLWVLEGYARIFSLLLLSDRSVSRIGEKKVGLPCRGVPSCRSKTWRRQLGSEGEKVMTRMKSHELSGCGDKSGPSPKNIQESDEKANEKPERGAGYFFFLF